MTPRTKGAVNVKGDSTIHRAAEEQPEGGKALHLLPCPLLMGRRRGAARRWPAPRGTGLKRAAPASSSIGGRLQYRRRFDGE